MSSHRWNKPGRRARHGFTLVELLVVITIIGMLMALLLPAVNAAVEAARNVQCKNNLGQISKAVNVYQNGKNQYPGYENTIAQDRIGSWIIEILPQLDRLDLHADYTNPDIMDTVLESQYQPYMEILACPSDPPESIEGPLLSYVANSGWAQQNYSNTTGPNSVETLPYNGLFHKPNLRANVDHIGDGSSNTLLLTENVQARKANESGSGWATLDSSSDYGTIRQRTTFVWHEDDTDPRKINKDKTSSAALTLDYARPSSFHSGGVNVAFADTHVIFMKEGIDYSTQRQLMTPYHSKSDAGRADSLNLMDPVLDATDYR